MMTPCRLAAPLRTVACACLVVLPSTLAAEGTTIVMVTHSPAHADYARRTVNLFDGHVVTDAQRAA